MYGQRSPSVVYDLGADVPADALFLDSRGQRRYGLDRGISARGWQHACHGVLDIAPLPVDPAGVTPDAEAIARLEAISERLSPCFRAEKIMARQACFRPVTQDGLPLIGSVPNSRGLYVATRT